MITVGLDLGAGSTKAAALQDGTQLLATVLTPNRGGPAASGKQALADLCVAAHIQPQDVGYVCTTGFGRYAFEGRDLQVSDITASARGAVFLHPDTRHVVDIGTQSSRAIAVNERGRVVRFKMNEKCAAGAGRFVERCSKYLQVPLTEMGELAEESGQPRAISSVCAVLAETEIINYVAEETPLPDILMGVFQSLAQRAHSLMKFVGIEPKAALVGGLVHNAGVVRALRDVAGMEVLVDPRAHHAAAIGAAVLGHQRLQRRPETAAPTRATEAAA